ncbi:hypothetical protein [Pandoraea bronchicola]|uniref:Uncharacterized protein n=1 Tax=Pandoraea bronchicola TaxID=2508287 RepID=A0A5E5BRW3_9BURK|nr:hypothetical protein [Pandoraea bronchicola]VVE88037.1 hypothetical protein PBR20603_01981 [Pandoraea bronchicola]
MNAFGEYGPIVQNAVLGFIALALAIAAGVSGWIALQTDPFQWWLAGVTAALALACAIVVMNVKLSAGEIMNGKRPDRFPESHHAQAPRIMPRITLALLIAT